METPKTRMAHAMVVAGCAHAATDPVTGRSDLTCRHCGGTRRRSDGGWQIPEPR